MLLHEIKQIEESTSYPDISIERHPDAVFQHERLYDRGIQDERPRVEFHESVAMVTNYGQAMRSGFAVIDKRTYDTVPASLDIKQKRVRLDVHDDLQKYVVVSVTSDGIVPQSDWTYNYS